MRWRESLCTVALLLCAVTFVTEARVEGKLPVGRVKRDPDNDTMPPTSTTTTQAPLLEGPHVCTRRISESRTVTETYRQPYTTYSRRCIFFICFLKPMESRTVTETYRQPYTTFTTRCIFRFCFRLPKTAYRQAYRSVIKRTVVAKRACCPGYHQEEDSCLATCYMCVHGTCTAPDVCTCNEGYVGQQCRCDGQHYGSNCELSCDCQNGGTCGGDDSRCFCAPGFTGDHCENQCPEGTYGDSCDNQCTCENGDCDPVTGECTCHDLYTGPTCNEVCENPDGCLQCPCLNGGTCNDDGSCVCAAGYKGDVCGEPCDTGTYGAHCASDCLCHHGGTCDPITGACSCLAGFIGDNCEQECEVGRYGENCAQTCNCLNGGTCTSGGQCLCTMGWHGSRCEGNICPYGPPQYEKQHYTDEFHWPYCIPCHCNVANTERCHPWGGHCECRSGWGGVNCDTVCAEGFWGKGCTNLCDCTGSHCDREDGHCICPPGYTGNKCNDTCPEGRYGSGCAEQCTCENGAACSPVDGTCTCLPGWTGYRCDEPCPRGMYGLNCNQTCECQNEGWCSPINGSCTCRPGFTGEKCEMACPSMTYGQDCAMRCNCSDHASSCDGQTGQCICEQGWRGDRCDSNCPPHRWGANCTQTCSCQNNGTCHVTSGTCECPLGFMGDSCETACPEGRFGHMCSGVCSDRCQNGASCNRVSGECICKPGFTSPSCSERCPGGYYGDQCSQPCTCQNGTCDHVDGTCTCLPGWTGSTCDQRCPEGSWGQDCQQTCDHCMNGASCLPFDGTCLCTAGWAGPQCSEACPAGYFGENCNTACNCEHGVCEHILGTCTCDDGWTGDICNFDADECAVSDNGCHANADCFNSPGSYRCVCRSGFVGDGRDCQPQSVGAVILQPLPILNQPVHDTILFTCRYSNQNPYEEEVIWKKGEAYLFLGSYNSANNQRLSVDYSVEDSNAVSRLTIRQTVKSDSGPYTCFIKTNPPTSSTGILNVQCPEGYYGSDCSRRCSCGRGQTCDQDNGCLPCNTDQQSCDDELMSFGGSLNITSVNWRPELADKTTPDHQKLASAVEFGLNEVYRVSSLSEDFLHAKVTGFRRGSVMSDFKLYFRPGGDVEAEDVGEQLRGRAKIGGLDVNPAASGIEGDNSGRGGDKPSRDRGEGGKAGIVAGVVIGVVIFLLLVALAFIAYRFHILKRRTREPTVSYDRRTTSIGADNPVFNNLGGAAAPVPGVQVQKGEHLMYMNNPLYDQVNGMMAPEKPPMDHLPPAGAEAPPPYEESPAELQLTEQEVLKLQQKAMEAGYPE